MLAALLRVSPPLLADTACNMLAGELVRQEHALRAVRMAHWSWEAMQHMDGLVQVYAQLLTQASGVPGCRAPPRCGVQCRTCSRVTLPRWAAGPCSTT